MAKQPQDDQVPANAPDFQDLLDTSAGEFSAPVPLPAGTYLARCISREYIKSSKKGTNGVQFQFQIMSAEDDVDLTAFVNEKTGDQLDITQKVLRDDFWITPDAVYRIGELADKCGVPGANERSNRELIEEIVMCQVMINVIQQPSTKPGDTRTFSNISSYAPV